MTRRITRDDIDAALEKASTTRNLIFGAGVFDDAARFVSDKYPDRPVIIIADERTFEVAGTQVLNALAGLGHAVTSPVVFPAQPTVPPNIANVERIRRLLTSAETTVLPVAVGSGTINDLVKRAAFEATLPYIVVATAASMDGYTASGAALIHEGVKQTFECPAPVAVIADLDILCAAPRSLTASGYGDLVGKVTAGADWLIADAFGIEPIQPQIWEMVQGPLRGIIADPERFQQGEPEAIEQLFYGLIITGLAIQISGSSRPASGSEHQFSHLWEMRGLEYEGEPVSHGYKVGMGSLVSTALYERLLERDVHLLDVDRVVMNWPTWPHVERRIRSLQDHPTLINLALTECRAKYIEPDELRARLELLREQWLVLRASLRKQLLPVAELQKLLEAGGCPTQPERIGLTLGQVQSSCQEARLIRRRYTIYDLAHEAGILDELVGEMFAPDGHWSASLT